MLTVISFILILGVLILVHELGHFITAIKLGVKVEEFGIGFPPRAWSKIKNGVRYSINWIPLGGFVKIRGESGEDRNDSLSFASKAAWKRLVVLSAGVFMNIVLAAFLFSVGFMIGIPQTIDETLPPTAIVHEEIISIVNVASESAASLAGIQPGDELVSLDSYIFSTEEEARAYIQAHSETEIQVTIKRADAFYSYSIIATPLAVAEGAKVLGIALMKTGVVSYPWYLAPVEGVKTALWMTKEIVIAFIDLIKNLVVKQQVDANVSGPIGIAVMTGQIAQMGFIYLLQFTAMLSLNLAVLNFIPFPALDGGRALFVIIEKMIGRPVKAHVEAIVHNAGFAILMILVVLVTYRDLIRFGSEIFSITR